ncbi:MAG: alkaline phosphatase family protein, partial [Anaerolineae bacterium]|nr:alkaline phosphatase family protein [Anaerolineae bacterium]
MINEESVRAASTAFGPYFVRPVYDTYNFARIPATIRHLLTGEDAASGLPPRTFGLLPTRYQKVILILVDGFGWRFVQRHGDELPFVRRIASEGVISRLSSQFPSTTAAHLTTIHTGMTVGESGLYEWNIYEPMLDAIVQPLMFSFAGEKARNTLQRAGVHPKTLYPRRTFYQDLAARGVRSFIFQNRMYTPSPYSDAVFDGATVVPYITVAEALANLTDRVAREKGPAYFFLYIDG